jgi:Domain of unknown function (DUF4396)
VPAWLTILAIVSLVAGGLCAIWISLDILAGHRQHMWIMNLVWPITALYAGPIALYAYYKVGRLSTRRMTEEAQRRGETPPGSKKPFWQMVMLADTHCGAGCTLGDLMAEWGLVLFPLTLFGQKIFAAWLVDYVLAFGFGIIFQYFTIAPMRGLGFREGIKAAVKADTLSLTAWQVGMYGWMASAIFGIFQREIEKTDPVFWFMMQIAMLVGFLTSYPVNWWLLRAGLKEKM